MNLTQQEIKSLIHLAEKESSFSSVVDKLKTHIKVESKRGQLCRVWDDDNDTFFLQVCAGDGEFLNDACFLDEQKVCEWENFQPLPFFIDIEASRKKGEVVPVEALTPVVTWVEGDKDSITLEFDNEPLPKKWETLTKDNWEQYRDKIVWCRDLDPNFLCRCNS